MSASAMQGGHNNGYCYAQNYCYRYSVI